MQQGDSDTQNAPARARPKVLPDGGAAAEIKESRSDRSSEYAPAVDRREQETTPRAVRSVFTLDDLEPRARQRLPVPVFGYVSGVAERGAGARAVRDAFDRHVFVPRVLKGTADRDQHVELFGHRYAHPFGIAPMGLSALAAYDGDVVLGRAARAAGSLAVMSATSLTPLERVAREAGSGWFQAYFPGDARRIDAMTDRVAKAGYDVLVVTADVPLNGNREIDRRNHFATPLKPTAALAWQGITHPRWLFGTALRTLAMQGMPRFDNLDAGRGPPILARNLERSFSARELLNWEHVERVRKRWSGQLVIKGILSPEDAALARQIGCDGVIVSSHGGRQLDGTAAPLEVLPDVKAQAGAMVVMIDSGFRRGTDVLKALVLGADFVFVGRPFLYAAALAGEAGVRHTFRILATEVDRDMAFLGVQDLSALHAGHLTVSGGRLPNRATAPPTP